MESFASSLYARAVEAERQRRLHPGRQQLMARRRQLAAIVYAPEARERALLPIFARLAELEDRRGCTPGSWTPRAELARELGISSVRLGRWIERGRVPTENMADVLDWAQRRIDEQLIQAQKRGAIERLLEEAKRPGWEPQLSGSREKKPAQRAPDLHDGEHEIDNRDARGYNWIRRVESFSSMAMIAELETWALSVRVPRRVHLGKARLWVVTALCSIYKRRAGGRSPGARRSFGRDPYELGRDLQIGAAVSSTTIRRGGLPRAVRLWKAEMIAEHCQSELVFVHGLIVRHWRRRADGERLAFDRRERELWRQRSKEHTERRKRSAKTKRAKARKKALRRRGR